MNYLSKARPVAGLFNNLSFQRKVITHCHYTTSPPPPPTSSTNDVLAKLVKNNKVVVFMKGVPDQPRCGFSNAVVQIMRMHGVQYDAHNVLADEAMRQGIKEFSNWPTIPQVYINGEFVGGCDILLQMHQSGDLVEELQKAGIRSALLDKPQESTTSSETDSKGQGKTEKK